MNKRADLKATETWLNKNAPQYGDVDGPTMLAIAHFVLVWGLFDQRYFDSQGNLDAVLDFANNRVPRDARSEEFDEFVDYFEHRYLDGLTPNHLFETLVMNDHRSGEILSRLLVTTDLNSHERITFLLLTCYVLRCNLVHGRKWNPGLADQYDNLNSATKVTMLFVENF